MKNNKIPFLHHVANISPVKIRTFKLFFKGFLFEMEDGRYAVYKFITSVKASKAEKNKLILIKSEMINQYSDFVTVSFVRRKAFLESLGMDSADALKLYKSWSMNSAINLWKLRLFELSRFIGLPFVMIYILLKCTLAHFFTKEKKDMPFNYYHATDIPDSLYDEIIQSHYPEGFDQAYRADKLREIIKTYSISRAQYWLDLGCGLHSLLSEAEGDNGAVIHLLDPNPEARKSYETYKDDFKNTKLVFSGGIGEKLPYKDHMFGFIYCGGVLAHVKDMNLFLKECKRVLKPGGVLVVDESNEYPHVPFVSTKYVSSLKNEIRGNQQVADRYTEAPPRVFRANPWSYWGCSTDHFWIFNFKGLRSLLSSDFSVDDFGAIGSYLSNNGTVNAFPMFYSLNFGSIVDMFVDYKALPGWYQKLTGKLFIDTGVYIYSVCIA